MKAYIYFDTSYYQHRDKSKDYSGEGPYILVDESGKVLGQHYCSSRGWAERDLTIGWEDRIQALYDHGITEVWSNDKLVWSQHKSLD